MVIVRCLTSNIINKNIMNWSDIWLMYETSYFFWKLWIIKILSTQQQQYTLLMISHSKKNKIKFWTIQKLYLIESCSKPRSFDQSVIIRLEKQSKLKTNKPYFLKMSLLFLIFEQYKSFTLKRWFTRSFQNFHMMRCWKVIPSKLFDDFW